jgi:hypothetical protein
MVGRNNLHNIDEENAVWKNYCNVVEHDQYISTYFTKTM